MKKKLKADVCSRWTVNFNIEEVVCFINSVKSSKMIGLDGIDPEFLKHRGTRSIQWLGDFGCDILRTGKLPRYFK